jgi:hypothetical protein
MHTSIRAQTIAFFLLGAAIAGMQACKKDVVSGERTTPGKVKGTISFKLDGVLYNGNAVECSIEGSDFRQGRAVNDYGFELSPSTGKYRIVIQLSDTTGVQKGYATFLDATDPAGPKLISGEINADVSEMSGYYKWGWDGTRNLHPRISKLKATFSGERFKDGGMEISLQ